ncbi:response regulator [Polaribacter cellanae]|uniref:Response regulator n=1 Tax=Polaribacter cellanae TaxID=2818493 RepID=A0A975H8F7_9FLAO|nr:response regulator [Polaribacter cellanae]QTE23999.1 response regulator [Polaribacter cellanae]
MKFKLNNLLVIEDNPYIGKEIVNATKKVTRIKNIRLTKTLQEAISFINDNDFDLVTLDLSLPDGNGIELLKWFTEKNIKKKVFVFSTSTELKRTCLRYGALAFFDKSTGFDELIENIKRLNQ